MKRFNKIRRKTSKKFNRFKEERVVTSEDELIETFHSYTYRKVLFIILCIVIMFVVIGFAVTIGSYPISFWETYEAIWYYLIDDIQDKTVNHVVINLRLPRIVEGIFAGAGLAVAGAVMQSVMKNPLADPYTTGISSGASLGATLAMISGISIVQGQYAIVVNAFVFSLIPAAVIIVVSKLKGASPVTMILSGLAIMYFFNAITTTLMLYADPDDTAAVYAWQVGTLSTASWDEIPLMAAVVIIGTIVLCFLSSRINILASGDEGATTLGINAGHLRIICIIIV